CFEKARPGTDVAPPRLQRNHGHASLRGSRLGDADVDGHGRHVFQDLAYLAHPARRAMQRRNLLQRREEVRLEPLQRLTEGVVAPSEDPGVPEIVAAVEHASCRLRVWLLDETLDL